MIENDEFDQKLKKISLNEIKEYLQKQKKPVFESQLIKFVFKDMNIINDESLVLYQNHFLLFHVLFLLQEEYYKENKYLHIHFMRIFLLDYPENGKCRFYNEEINTFCDSICENNSNYCTFHLNKLGNTKIQLRTSKFFYLDKSNYYKLNKDTADDFINGSWEILSKYNEYAKSFKCLELPETATFEEIKKQYKYLAKKYHPDSSKDISKKFNEINNAYNFLYKIIVFNKKNIFK